MLLQENGEKGVVLFFTINRLYFYLIYERWLLTICEGKINKYLCETEDSKFAKRNYHLKRARQRFTYKNMISRIVMFYYLTYTIYSVEKVSNLRFQWKYPYSGSLSQKIYFTKKSVSSQREKYLNLVWSMKWSGGLVWVRRPSLSRLSVCFVWILICLTITEVSYINTAS